MTRKGIGLPTGSPAINRTPRHTIETAVREAIGPTPRRAGGDFCPGRRFARKKPSNARLGILGGILDYRHHGDRYPDVGRELEALALLELEIKRAAGLERVVLVPGNHGERFVREQMGIDPQMGGHHEQLCRLHD